MIHIFNCFGQLCKLPGQACSGCSELCKQINCDICQQGCANASKACSGFVSKPLSSFVVITILISLGELYQVGTSISSKKLSDCKLPEAAWVSIKIWCYVQMLFALVNIIFAPYFQWQVWEMIKKKVNEDPEGPRPGGDSPTIEVKKDKVQAAFKDVFLNDFGVLAYFFVLIASFVWSIYGFDWIVHGTSKTALPLAVNATETVEASNPCNPGKALTLAANLGWFFFWLAVFYTLCWYCCSCCAGATSLKDENYEEVRQEQGFGGQQSQSFMQQ